MSIGFLQAKYIANQELAEISRGSGDLWVFTDVEQIDGAGWLFFYNTQAFVHGNLSQALAGNLPMLVNNAGELSYLTFDAYEKLLIAPDS